MFEHLVNNRHIQVSGKFICHDISETKLSTQNGRSFFSYKESDHYYSVSAKWVELGVQMLML